MDWSKRVRVATVLAVGIAAAILCLPHPALADDTALGGIAGDYYPVASTDIRMESETVQAICYRNYAEFRVDFRFVNSGERQTILLGFPFAVEWESKGADGLIGFRAWQDGKPLAVTLGEGPDLYMHYYLHQATFPTGKSMITVRYLASPTVSAGDRYPELMPAQFNVPGMSGWQSNYDYWLHTGAGWAGTIGKAVIRFTMADDFRGYGMDIGDENNTTAEEYDSGVLTTPFGYTKLGDRVYQWVFTDFDPTEYDDVNLAFSKLFMSDDSAPVPQALGAVAGTVTSSQSVAPPDDATAAFGVIDDSPRTSVGLKGVHPRVQIGIEGDHAVREIHIVPGKNDSLETYSEYGRPKRVKITLSSGATSTVTLADLPSVQRFAVSGTADWVRLDVLDTYPGTKSSDVYLSDVGFSNQPAPVFERFDALIASAPASTTSTTVDPGSATSLYEASTETTAAPSTTTPASTSATSAPPTSAKPVELADITPTGKATGVWTIWLIVAVTIAGAALVTSGVLTALLVARRKADRQPPTGA